jgi:beta-glucosidase/6-phospho-beta-glucosidase/beta-galactosidase
VITPEHSDRGFLWAVGIEDTAIGTAIRDGGRPLDEYELTGHYRRWRDDLRLAADSGANAIRYGVPWYRVSPRPGQWDWRWLDQAFEFAAAQLGLTVLADLVHYGTPVWLPGAFTDPAYPDVVAEYAAEVAGRYAGLVGHFTPLNEPLVTASFCGLRAIWPPYESGDGGWARVVLGVAAGMQRATAAIRAVQPDATIVHVEAAHVWLTADPSLRAAVDHQELRKFLPTDLLAGRVDPAHPLHSWLLGLGTDPDALARLRADAQPPDLIGVNYYPELSPRELVRHDGRTVSVAVDLGAEGLRRVLREFHDRYGTPVLLSETSVEGDAERQAAWLRDSVAAIGGLRAERVPVVGYTWWPLFDFVDWSWASNGRPIEEFHTRIDGRVRVVAPPARGDDVTDYLRTMGLYRLRRQGSALEPRRTPAVDEFRRLTTEPMPSLPRPHPLVESA